MKQNGGIRNPHVRLAICSHVPRIILLQGFCGRKKILLHIEFAPLYWKLSSCKVLHQARTGKWNLFYSLLSARLTQVFLIYIYKIVTDVGVKGKGHFLCWYFSNVNDFTGPPLWYSGQSSWLHIQRPRVPFPALPDLLRSSGSGTGSTQPREYNWGVTW
jgi:hypothetical protein